ncbi:MAG: hypothetical protein AB1898_12760 [Acidobacteriota bacterium]
MRRLLLWFISAAGLHFALSVAGTILALRAAFDVKRGFWSAPGAVTLAYLSEILLFPLALVRMVIPVGWQGGYAEVAMVSLLFGCGVAAILHLRSRRRDAR